MSKLSFRSPKFVRARKFQTCGNYVESFQLLLAGSLYHGRHKLCFAKLAIAVGMTFSLQIGMILYVLKFNIIIFRFFVWHFNSFIHYIFTLFNTLFMLYLIVVIVAIVVIKFLYDRDKLLSGVVNTGGLTTQYKTLIDYMLPNKNFGKLYEERDHVRVVYANNNVRTTFQLIPAFDILIVKWKFECPGLEAISNTWDFKTNEMTQEHMIEIINIDISKKTKDIFEKTKQSTTSDQQGISQSKEQRIIDAYRSFGKRHNTPPTSKLSDLEIITIYNSITSSFKNAANKKGDFIPLPFINTIVLQFLNVYEMFGKSTYESHLEYEVGKYLDEGLREDYQIPMMI